MGLPWLVTLTMRVTALMATTFLITHLLRRSSALVRHACWTATLAGALVIPAADRWAPPIPVRWTPALRVAEAVHPAAKLGIGATATEMVRTPGDRDSRVSLFTMLAVVWAGGSALLLVRLVVSVRALRAVERNAAKCDDPRWTRVLAGLQARRRVTLLVSADIDVPIASAVPRAVIIVPDGCDDWSDAERAAVIAHELTHLERGDAITILLARLTCALHWINPLVWFAARRLDEECELACDEAVLRRGVPASMYADALLSLCERILPTHTSSLHGAAVAFARRAPLRMRIEAVLRCGSNPRHMGGRVAGALLASTLCTLVLGVIHLDAAEPVRPAEPPPMLAPQATRPTPAPITRRTRGTRALPSAGRFSTDDVTAALIETLADPSPQVREAAARSLGHRGDPAAASALRTRLRDASPKVRAAAQDALDELPRAR